MTDQTAAAPVSAAEDARPLLKPADVSVVRIAQPEDIEGLMDLARMMHGEVGLLPFCEWKVRAAITQAVKARLVGVTGHPQVHGCLCLEIGEPYYTEAKLLIEFLFFVHPDHRQGDYARSLLAWAKFLSDGIAMPLMVGVFGTKRTEGKIRLCGRQLQQVGATFMHNLHFAAASHPVDEETS